MQVLHDFILDPDYLNLITLLYSALIYTTCISGFQERFGREYGC